MRFYRTLSLFLVGASTASVPSFAKNDCEKNYRALEQVIENGFKTGVDAHFPKSLLFSITRKEGSSYLLSAQKLWKDYWPDLTLLKELKAAELQGNVSVEVLSRLKSARARLKVIRFLCEAICKDHVSPPQLDRVTKTLGKLEVMESFGQSQALVDKSLEEVLDAFSDKSMRKMAQEIAAMRSDGRQGNERWLQAALQSISQTMDLSQMTETEFHEVRKNIGRIQTMLLFEGLNHDDSNKLAAFSWLSDLYGKFGIAHDALVKQEVELHVKELDTAEISLEFRESLKKILQAMRH